MLRSGWYPLSIEHYQAKGAQRLAVLWQAPGDKDWKRFDRYAYRHDGDGSGDQLRLLTAMSSIPTDRIEGISRDLAEKVANLDKLALNFKRWFLASILKTVI